jgi:hypothetical protein
VDRFAIIDRGATIHWGFFASGGGPEPSAARASWVPISRFRGQRMQVWPLAAPSGGGGAINLVGANCTQANASSTGAISFGAETINLAGANCTQANSSGVGAISIGGVSLTALAGYTVEARPRRAAKPKALAVKDPDESVYILFDFRLIAASVAGAQVRVTRFSGAADADPAAIADGAPQTEGPRVFQRVEAGVDACTYHLECEVNAPDGSRYVLAALLPVRSA